MTAFELAHAIQDAHLCGDYALAEVLENRLRGIPNGAARSSLVADMNRISAACRALASEADRAKIDAVLSAPTCRRPVPAEPWCPWCPWCGAADFSTCWCDD